MANIEVRFKDDFYPLVYATVEKEVMTKSIFGKEGEVIKINITDINGLTDSWIRLDKSTAIKFAKTIRTEIAKIKDNE